MNPIDPTGKAKAAKKQRYSKRATAIETRLGDGGDIELAATKYAPKVLAAIYRDWIAKTDAADAARVSWDTARRERDAAETKLRAIEEPLKDKLASKFGRANPILSEFGYKPAKTPERTAESKAKAAQKGKKTRELLGTKGKRQKKAALEAAKAAEATAHSPEASSPHASTNGGGTGAPRPA
jgi:hypothetical protein